MKILFMGSGTFGLPVLDAIRASRHTLAAVVTASDKPTGRGRVMTPSPIKTWAQPHGIPVLTPLKINTPESLADLRQADADVFVVASYGALLSKDVLAVPPRGCINVHPSLLPLYRGASPIVQTLLDGRTETGMTIMAMALELDAGDILLQERFGVGADENARELTDRLAGIGGRMTVQALDLIEAGRATRTPQDASRATYCAKIKKDASLIDWTRTASEIHSQVRALVVWPGAVTRRNGKALRILETRIAAADGPVKGKPGEVMELLKGEGIRVQTGSGTLFLKQIQPEGGRIMSHQDYLNGSSLKPGETLI